MRRILRPLCTVLLALAVAGLACAQVPVPDERRPVRWDPALAFLEPYGLHNFSDHYVDALSTLLVAQGRVDAGAYAAAKSALDGLWARYPVADPSWGALPTQPFGIFIGSPPCYYGLRMLSLVADWHVANPGVDRGQRTVRLTVLLAGTSSGIEPRNLQELQQGTGVPVQHQLDPRLLENDAAIVRQSLHLYRQYVLAMTEGGLDVDVRILHRPDLDLPVHAEVLTGRYFAGLTDPTTLWYHVAPEDVAETDWWWVLYPSHVPEQYPDFEDAEFVTGGMGSGPINGSPCFLVDDRWLVRKPPHLGEGPYRRIERDAYLPQWLQHEAFHHLFSTYRELGLEATSHQWFDPANWPPDFVGRYEADYYHEALTKRLQDASPPLTSALRFAIADAPWSSFTYLDFLGDYQRSPVENPWHLGSIQLGPGLEWQNQAGVDWDLQAELPNVRFLTGPDCPYYANGWFGSKFDVVFARDDLGDFLPEIRGFGFLGELYERVGP